MEGEEPSNDPEYIVNHFGQDTFTPEQGTTTLIRNYDNIEQLISELNKELKDRSLLVKSLIEKCGALVICVGGAACLAFKYDPEDKSNSIESQIYLASFVASRVLALLATTAYMWHETRINSHTKNIEELKEIYQAHPDKDDESLGETVIVQNPSTQDSKGWPDFQIGTGIGSKHEDTIYRNLDSLYSVSLNVLKSIIPNFRFMQPQNPSNPSSTNNGSSDVEPQHPRTGIRSRR